MRPTEIATPTVREALRTWTAIGLESFGGPAGQIAVMHRVLVEERRWIDERRFLHALNYCMLLPGPEAQQLATYVGWLLHGWRGGLMAGGLFILPGFVAILALSVLYVTAGHAGLVAGLFFGLQAAVLAVVIEAVGRIGRRVLKNGTLVALAGLAFVALFFFQCPFPVVVVTAGVLGLLGVRIAPGTFGSAPDETGDAPAAAPSWTRSAGVLALGAVLWLGPIAALRIALGPQHVFVDIAVFFSKAAVVTFGGAYAVLAYIAQQAVETYGWLAPGEMLDGLGMAETTPGPLVQVVQFVGFLGAYRDPGTLPPLVAAVCGAVITTWVTFVPCFLWIFLGAPYIERLRAHAGLTGALTAITASVVGVILNLALWLGLHVLFARVEETSGPLGMRVLVPEWGTLDVFASALAVAAFVALERLKAPLIPTLLACAAAGAAWRLAA